MEVADFLRRHPPFDSLDDGTLRHVASAARRESYPAGTIILRQSGEPATVLYVVASGSVELLDGDQLLDLLSEGELFGQFSLFSGSVPNITVRAAEDTECYLVPHHLAEEVLGTSAGLAFLTASARRRMARGAEARELRVGIGPEAVDAGSLVSRAPVTCPPTATVGEAAVLMSREHVSAVVIPLRDEWGIVTDRDLRSRVLAAARPADTPVSEVMSHPALTVPADTMAAEVLLSMLDADVHHFPVLDPNGRLLGVLTDSDLMGIERNSPFTVRRQIDRAADEAAVVEAARRIPEAVCWLVDSGSDPVDVGHIVGVTIDALTRRFIQLAIDRQGPPPVPWAWLALGSAARHEQALLTDQDHALAFDPGERAAEEVDPYFEKLARSVTDGLEAAGIPRCRGGAMAENPPLRRSVDGWTTALRGWMADPGLEGSILSSIVFDYRRAAGPLEVDAAMDRVIRTAPANPIFMRHLSRRALDEKPPTGFFRDLVVRSKGEHAGTLDIKHGGIVLIGNLARAYAVGSGIVERQTLRRLRAAAEAGRITNDERQSLEEAFRLLWAVRLDHQVRCVREGRPPDDFVDPKTLGPLTRGGLKDAFRIIAAQQRVLAADLGVNLR